MLPLLNAFFCHLGWCPFVTLVLEDMRAASLLADALVEELSLILQPAIRGAGGGQMFLLYLFSFCFQLAAFLPFGRGRSYTKMHALIM